MEHPSNRSQHLGGEQAINKMERRKNDDNTFQRGTALETKFPCGEKVTWEARCGTPYQHRKKTRVSGHMMVEKLYERKSHTYHNAVRKRI